MTIDSDKYLEKFAAAPFAQRVQLFLAAIGASELDHDTAWEMLETLYVDTAVHNQRPRFTELVAAVRAQAPDLYAAEAGTLLEWQISHNLADGRTAQIPALTQELAQWAATFPAELLAAAEKLAYFGQLEPLAAMLSTAWPHIQEADFAETAVEEYVVQAMNYLIMQRITSTPTLEPDDTDLLALLDPFAEIDAHELRAYVAQLTGQQVRAWQPADFSFPPPIGKETAVPEQVEANLTDLLREFMHVAHATEGIPLSRAALAYWPLHEYIRTRLAESARTYKTKRKQNARFARRSYGLSPLCPTPTSLAQFLADMLEDWLPRHYPAAALVAILPAWLRFLQTRHLITPEQQNQAMKSLQELLPELREFWSDMPTDPGLVASLEVWE